MNAPALTKAEVIELAREMRKEGVARFRVGEVEVVFDPGPAMSAEQWKELSEREKKLRRAAEKEANDPARKKSW